MGILRYLAIFTALSAFCPLFASGECLFRVAADVPPDVTMFIQVDDAAGLRRAVAERPIAHWFESLVADGSLAKSWAELSALLRVDQGELFDQLFGRSLTLIMRRDQWAVVTEVESDVLKRLTHTVVMKRQLPLGTTAVMEWPEQGLLVGTNGQTLLIGPSSEPGLFRELAQHHESSKSLDSSEAIRRGRLLSHGAIAVYMQHDQPLGGWSVLTMALDGDTVEVDQLSEFEQWPFVRAMSKKETVDISPLRGVKDSCVAAILEPADIGDSQVESFVAASLGTPLVGGRLRESMGDSRMVILGQVDGRAEARRIDVLIPSLAIAIQVDDEADARLHADAHMSHVADRIARLRNAGGNALFAPIPIDDREFRAVALNPNHDSFGRLHPVAQTLSLNWQVIRVGEQPYCVIASHQTHLMDTVKALKASSGLAPQHEPALANAGVLHGQRLSIMAAGLGEQVRLFAEDGSLDEFRSFFSHAASLARGLGLAEWQLSRPSETSMELSARIQLSPSESQRSP